jgi:glycosyltransferase involved in cell wall biosynthesis
LKILQATEYFLPDAERGIERFVYELSKVLAGAGQSVTMLSGSRGRGLVLGGVRLERTPSCAGDGRGPRISSVNSGSLAMHRQRPDIVHAHHFGSGYAASLLKKYDGIPYVLTIHQVPPADEPIYREMYRKAIEGASAVVSASDSVRDWIEKEFGVFSRVIPLSMGFAIEGQVWAEAVQQYMSIYESAVNIAVNSMFLL